MKRILVWGVFLAVAFIGASWLYLFHDYISGNRWAWVKYKLGTFDSPTVILGKEGSLFTRGTQDDIDDYRGMANPGTKVARFKELVTKRNELVRSLGGRFLYVICPINETVYNELLPREYQKVGDRRRATLAMEAMRGSGVEMIYLTPVVTEAKSRGRVFYKYESHWNWFGSYVGSRAVISHLAQYFPAMQGTLARISEYDLVTGPPAKNMWNNDQNYGNHLGITLLELDPQPVPKGGWTTRMESKKLGRYRADVFTKDDPSLPTLVMFGDSFMAGMRWVLAENFRRAVFLNPWTTAAPQLPDDIADFPAEVIEAEKPDVVVYDRWERSMLKSYSEWADEARQAAR